MRQKYASLKKRAISKNLPVTLTFDQFRYLKLGDCHYCGVSELFIKFYCELMRINTPWMTIDRKNNDLGYTPENCVTSCYLCNKTKSNFFSYEDMLEIAEKFIKPKLKNIEKEATEMFGEWCEMHVDTEEDFY
jgi:hypothetical protein